MTRPPNNKPRLEANPMTCEEVDALARLMHDISELILVDISLGDLPVLDSNGEVLGALTYDTGEWRFVPA